MSALKEVLEAGARLLESSGARAWEIAASRIAAVGVEVQDGELTVIEQSEALDCGIRVLDGGTGFAGLSEPSDAALARAVEGALFEARRSRKSALASFASPAEGEGAEPVLAFFDARATGRASEALATQAMALEALGRACPGIARVRPARIDEERGSFALWTSSGLKVHERHARAAATIHLVAESAGDLQSWAGSVSAGSAVELDFGAMVAEAAEAAVALLDPVPFRTARVPVVFAPEAAVELFSLLGLALDGERRERGASFLAPSGAPVVLSPALTLIDDARDGTLDGAAWYDGEGLSTRRRTLVSAGVVTGWLDDRESAARAGRPAEGCALRASARERPAPGLHNLEVLPGPEPVARLLSRAEGGLWVLELAGTHTVNEVTGELSLGVRGWAVRGGARAEPVEGVLLGGRVVEILSSPIALSAESKRVGSARVPWLFSPDVQVSAGVE